MGCRLAEAQEEQPNDDGRETTDNQVRLANALSQGLKWRMMGQLNDGFSSVWP